MRLRIAKLKHRYSYPVMRPKYFFINLLAFVFKIYIIGAFEHSPFLYPYRVRTVFVRVANKYKEVTL